MTRRGAYLYRTPPPLLTSQPHPFDSLPLALVCRLVIIRLLCQPQFTFHRVVTPRKILFSETKRRTKVFLELYRDRRKKRKKNGIKSDVPRECRVNDATGWEKGKVWQQVSPPRKLQAASSLSSRRARPSIWTFPKTLGFPELC